RRHLRAGEHGRAHDAPHRAVGIRSGGMVTSLHEREGRPMKSKRSGIAIVAVIALIAMSPAAHAQFAVIDVASVTQLIQQVQTAVQELQTAQSELAQARESYQSFTGTRGMQNLLSGTNRNYLPTDMASLEATLSGSGGTYGALASGVQAAMSRKA